MSYVAQDVEVDNAHRLIQGNMYLIHNSSSELRKRASIRSDCVIHAKSTSSRTLRKQLTSFLQDDYDYIQILLPKVQFGLRKCNYSTMSIVPIVLPVVQFILRKCYYCQCHNIIFIRNTYDITYIITLETYFGLDQFWWLKTWYTMFE